MRSLFLFTVSGPDAPGITRSLTQLLAEHDVQIRDIGQANIHAALSLGMLLECPPHTDVSTLQASLETSARTLGLQSRFATISEDDYASWVAEGGKPRYILTLLGREISADTLSTVASVLGEYGLNIDSIKRLSGRLPLVPSPKEARACVELSVRGMPDTPENLRSRLVEVAGGLPVDVAVQEDSLYRRNRRLVVFDMDSTLIQCEVIDELAKAAGVGEAVAAITERAMQGELDFKESFSHRLGLLRGLDQRKLAGIAERLPLTDGAERLIATLQQLGYKTAIISGGFTFFGRTLQAKLGIDYVFANELEIVDGLVTGRVIEPVVDGAKKAEILVQLAAHEGISLEQVIAVGDGANDIPMLSKAGLGIAFRAKPLVRQQAQQALGELGLDSILYLLGLHDRHAR